ncbi:DUF6265 family protein [Elongatibacter sediminis]|uniref:DUF6265 family protein n=1 Tax=Elongatibacter sediminis TaxID=3119006 RepID=A0AAW9R6B4_9GAMM
MNPSFRVLVFAAAAFLPSVPVQAEGLQPDWLQGRWCRDAGGMLTEETWMAPQGGETIGMSRTVKNDRMVGFEYVRIVNGAHGPMYVAQPNGGTAVSFMLTRRDETRLVFENPAHDFPQRIEYRRDGDRLLAEISGPGPDGDTVRVPFEYQLCGGRRPTS